MQTPAQRAASIENLRKARAAKRKAGVTAKAARAQRDLKKGVKPRAATLNALDKKRSAGKATKAELKVLKDFEAKSASLTGFKKRKRGWKPKYTPLSGGVGYQGRQAEKGRGSKYGRKY